ncbi:hypothetical protein DPMN_077144 [Dreissena polymorpha]|uniref:Uncharacterized protein n=1 Tax=Dreissena polymorpha TaxID=45954 RepID=A0A9D3YNN9_DREPO|nr:hypothetical protein DPMN_077144 [Dreissena polymorpha]
MPEPLAALREFRTLDVKIEETGEIVDPDMRSSFGKCVTDRTNVSLMLTSSARRCRRKKLLAKSAQCPSNGGSTLEKC